MIDKCLFFFKALADPIRMEIVDLLNEKGELRVSHICSHFDITQPSISHHLAVLREGGVVQTRKSGKEIYYSLNKKYILSLCSYYYGRFGFLTKSIGEKEN